MAEEFAANFTAAESAAAASDLRRHALAVGRAAEAFVIPFGALVVSLILFGAFVACAGVSPFDVYRAMALGSVGSWFSIQNTLTLSAPLVLTALCTALPAQAGLMIIGGEGAFVIGGVAAIAVGLPLAAHASPLLVQAAMAAVALAAGAIWIGMAGALRYWRGVNETISTLLLTYIAIAVLNQLVEGPMRDPSSLNKPSSFPLPDPDMIGNIPGTEFIGGWHWGSFFAFSLTSFCSTPPSASLRAWSAEIPVPRGWRACQWAASILIVSGLGGAAAGLAGMVEVAAVQGRASATLAAGYGFTGILVAFIARQNPLAVIPVAFLFGGLDASGGLLQRRLDLPDASVMALARHHFRRHPRQRDAVRALPLSSAAKEGA